MNSATLSIIKNIINIFCMFLFMRIWCCWARVDIRHPVVQSILKITHRVVLPLNSIFTRIGRYEWGSIITFFLIQQIFYILINLGSSNIPIFSFSLVYAFYNFISIGINTLFFATIIYAIMSWVNPKKLYNSPVQELFIPILRPFHTYLPFLQVGVIDFSLLAFFFLLQIVDHILYYDILPYLLHAIQHLYS